MNYSHKTTGVSVAAVLLAGMLAFMAATAETNASEKILFDFDGARAGEGWRAVNDNVMGGVSRGAAKFPGDGSMLFAGVLSLENRGGFSSVRNNQKSMDLSAYDGLTARVRGDGRTYWMTVGTSMRIPAGSFRTTFKTEPGKWTVVRAPFSGFRATSFGRELPAAVKLNRSQVRSIGFLIADKKAGPFRLEVDWIKAATKDSKTGPRPAAGGAKPGAMDIVETAVKAGKFRNLAAALKAAGLVDTLKGKGPFTVFAPTDEAFGKLPKGAVESLLMPENKKKLIAVLTHHVVAGQIALGDRALASLEGSKLSVSAAGSLTVNGARVLTANIAASNGIIHVIDKVLIPELPAPGPKDAARSLIELAIERGVPLFNSNKADACAAIYEVTARSLLTGHRSVLTESVRGRLTKSLSEAGETETPKKKAWVLRYALDNAYRSLK